jgi:hypothetical protein
MEVVNTEPLSLTGFLSIINGSIFDGFGRTPEPQRKKPSYRISWQKRITRLSKPKPTQF